jgi:hypothetical protein
MSSDTPDRRLTTRELRRALAEAGAPWSLARESDPERPPPRFPLGGEPPPNVPPPDRVEPTDLRALLRESPPGDPDLARACIEAGLLDPGNALSTERRRGDRPPRQVDTTSADAERRAPEPPAGDDVAPPQFGPRSDRVEPQ